MWLTSMASLVLSSLDVEWYRFPTCCIEDYQRPCSVLMWGQDNIHKPWYGRHPWLRRFCPQDMGFWSISSNDCIEDCRKGCSLLCQKKLHGVVQHSDICCTARHCPAVDALYSQSAGRIAYSIVYAGLGIFGARWSANTQEKRAQRKFEHIHKQGLVSFVDYNLAIPAAEKRDVY